MERSIEAVMGRLEPILDDLDAIARKGHEVYCTYPDGVRVEHTPRTQANCIHDHMVAAADRWFLDRADIEALDLQGLKLWLVGDHTAIRLKKMDEDGWSSAIQTKQQRAFDLMEPLDGLPPEPTRVVVGYVLDRIGTDIKRVQVARPNGRGIDWCAAIVPLDQREQEAVRWEDVTRQRRIREIA